MSELLSERCLFLHKQLNVEKFWSKSTVCSKCWFEEQQNSNGPTDFECSYPEDVWRTKVELLPDVFGRSSTQAVEDVVVPLLRALSADPGLLQQVVGHEAAHHGVLMEKNRKHN